MIAGILIGLVVGIVLAAFVARLVWQLRSAERRAEHERTIESMRTQVGRLEAELEGERKLGEERQLAWDEARNAFRGEFASISAQALRESNEQFLQLAEGRLELARQAANGDLDSRTKAIEELVSPMREQLSRNEDAVRRMQSERQKADTAILEGFKHLGDSNRILQSETRNLASALRAPATRGRWGEQQLGRVMEMAGMLEHCDYEQQVTVRTGDGRLRPDMVVSLPGGRKFVIDSKVPLQAFLDAMDATDEATKKTYLIGHARQLRAHVDALSKKAYWEQFDFSPEYVIAFIPGDELWTVALEQDPTLLDHAVEQRVIPATPSTLIALLRTVAFGFQQESLAENAHEVQRAGRELYKRLSTFGEHLAKTGRSLTSAVDSYNKAVGSLERNVLPQARRFEDLGVSSCEDVVPEPEQIESRPRLLEAPELTSGDSACDASGSDPEATRDGIVVEIEGPVRMLPFTGMEGLRARQG